MERMTGLDATFLYFETPTTHMHVCATIVFDPSTVPGGYSFERTKEVIRSRLHLVPPFRRKLYTVPFNLHHPVWVEDPNFDLDYHVRRIACPSPGGDRELAALVGDIAGRPLDRSRPLWELYIVENLEGGHTASIAKMHHATIDGVSGANLMVHLFDLQPDPEAEDKGTDTWTPDPEPSDLELVGYALWSRAKTPVRVARTVFETTKALGSIVQRRIQGESGMAAPFTAPRTSFNTTITPHRRVAFAQVPLDDVKEVKNAFRVKVNDVVVAVASGALRRYLAQGSELPDKSLVAVCPVSVREGEKRGDGGSNQVSAFFTSLASDIEEPVERLFKIAEANQGAKRDHGAIGADMLQNWTEFAAPTTFSLAARAYSSLKFAQRHPVVHNLVISNVPGPPLPLYFAGAKCVALYPLGPIFDGAALNVTVVSYMDTLYWGFIADREAMPRLWDLAALIPDALTELKKAAEQRAPTNA